jgi:hypothetical protein
LSRFEKILEAYGAAPECWPEAERDAALALARSSLPAARLLGEAKALDGILRQAQWPVPADAYSPEMRMLENRIVAAATARPRRRSFFGFGSSLELDFGLRRLWPSAAGLAVATVFGFVIGFSGVLPAQTSAESTEEPASISVVELASGAQL